MTYITQLTGCKVMLSSRILTITLTGLALVILQSSTVQAQWGTSGTNINNTNTGNVGVGTGAATPTHRLSVSVEDAFNNAVTQILSIGHGTTGTPAAGLGAGLTFRAKRTNGDMGYIGHIAGVWEDPTNEIEDGALVFAPVLNGAGYGTERMRITSAGNVDIGTANPGEKLVTMGNILGGNITSHTQLYSTYDSQNNVIMELGYGTATANVTPIVSLVLSKNLTSPNNALGVISFANSSIANGNDKRLSAIGSWTDGATNSGALTFYTNAAGTLDERMRITSAGKLGIGLTTPLYSLDVNGGVNGFRAKAATVSSSDVVATFENASGVQAIVRGNGNVGIGLAVPTEKLEVLGNIKVTGTGNINASGAITGATINAKYQDVAEWVESSQSLAAGTVVVLDHTRSNQVIASSKAYDTRVAGVISLQPGITLGEQGESKVLVATTGRVKVKVDASSGPIKVGDLLVTGDKEGFGKKSEPLSLGGIAIHRPGTLIGKALEPLAKGTGDYCECDAGMAAKRDVLGEFSSSHEAFSQRGACLLALPKLA